MERRGQVSLAAGQVIFILFVRDASSTDDSLASARRIGHAELAEEYVKDT